LHDLMAFMKKYSVEILLVVFTLLNIIGAAFTELYNDEAYYWAYSRFLDWGYFDHPPVIALLIKIGYALISNELGVRILPILTVSLSVYIMYKLAGTNDPKLFSLLLFSTFPFFLFGFTALPDSPMILSIALFFFIYARFLENESWKWTIALAMVMAFMLYTKYQCVLIILFTLVSNLSLLKRKWFWIASMLGAVLFLPHLYWQYANDFPSVRYHLVDRSAKSYDVAYTLEYIGAQLFFYGPFTGFFLYWASFKTKVKDNFERSLKYSVFGTLIFFLISTFKGRVEVNWTLGMLVPLVILALRYYQDKSVSRIWLERVAWTSIPIILLVRIHVISPLGEFKKDRAADFHGNRELAQRTMSAADGLPLAAHRYQTASSLWFYTGKPVGVLNIGSRFSQYDLWEFDSTLVNKPAAYVNSSLSNDQEISDGLGLKILDPFPGFKFIDVTMSNVSGKSQVQIKWNKPMDFYGFTKKYPVIISVEMKNKAGLTLLTKKWNVMPTSPVQIIPIDVPENLRTGIAEFQPSLETPELGVVRRYKSLQVVTE